jgi:threonine-phosphate decarboxylase
MNRFEHGGNVQECARRFGLEPAQIIDFSASINPVGLPLTARAALAAAVSEIVHYPDPHAGGLRQALARRLGVDASQVLAGNGATDLLYLLLQHLRPNRVVIPVPSFVEYERAVIATGCRQCIVETAPETGYRVDLEDLRPYLEEGDLCLLGHPNNPTGRLLDPETIGGLLEHDVQVVVDEAFIDFVDGRPSVERFARTSPPMGTSVSSPTLWILGSLTKFYAMPGLRVGYILADSTQIERLAAAQPPWSVNTMAQHAALAALQDEDYRDRTLAVIRQERAYLCEELTRLDLQPLPSSCNFLLVPVPCPSGLLWERLARKGVLVRDCGNIRGLRGDYVRIAVRTREENARLLRELREAL